MTLRFSCVAEQTAAHPRVARTCVVFQIKTLEANASAERPITQTDVQHSVVSLIDVLNAPFIYRTTSSTKRFTASSAMKEGALTQRAHVEGTAARPR